MRAIVRVDQGSNQYDPGKIVTAPDPPATKVRVINVRDENLFRVRRIGLLGQAGGPFRGCVTDRY
jgi:hypothetical protein